MDLKHIKFKFSIFIWFFLQNLKENNCELEFKIEKINENSISVYGFMKLSTKTDNKSYYVKYNHSLTVENGNEICKNMNFLQIHSIISACKLNENSKTIQIQFQNNSCCKMFTLFYFLFFFFV